MNWSETEPTQSELEHFQKIMPRRISEITFKFLNDASKFKAALESEIGQLLMADLIKIIEEKMSLIWNHTATDTDKCMLKACQEIGARWNTIFKEYKVKCEKVKKAGKRQK